jgi:4-amino-4-deoxy-L-arabinose transferase-like glycosyltransferase
VLISRLFSVAASVGTVLFLYGFVENITKDKNLAWLSGMFFALMPYSIFYSRVILPEPYVLLFSMGSLYFLVRAFKQRSPFTGWRLWASAVLLSLAILLKPFVVFLAPVYLVLIWQRKDRQIFWSPVWLLYAAVAVLPFLWWRTWIEQFPSGIPASDWLMNSDGIRFRPAWFRWIFYERLTKLLLGFAGLILAGAAFFWSKLKNRVLLIAWSLGLLAYVSIFATGNVRHDYYQALFMPLAAIFLGFGTYHLWRQLQLRFAKDPLLRKVGQAGVVILVMLTILLPWRWIHGYFNVNHWEYVEAGQAVDRLTPEGAKIIAPAFGDTQFLFQTNRTGWPIGFKIEDKINKGAEYYVTTSNDDEARQLEQQYQVLEKNDRFMIIDLTQPVEEQL